MVLTLDCLVISPLLMQVLKVIIFITLLCSALHTLCRAGALIAIVPWVHSALVLIHNISHTLLIHSSVPSWLGEGSYTVILD